MPEQSPNFHLTTRSASFASESPHLNFCTVQVSSHALVCMVQGRRSTITHKLDSEHLSLFVPIEPERGIRRCCCCISLRVCRPCSLVCWWRRGRNKYIDLENTNDQTADTCSRVEAGLDNLLFRFTPSGGAAEVTLQFIFEIQIPAQSKSFDLVEICNWL